MDAAAFIDGLFPVPGHELRTPEQLVSIDDIRIDMKRCATIILARLPECREQGMALDALRVAYWWACAGVEVHGTIKRIEPPENCHLVCD